MRKLMMAAVTVVALVGATEASAQVTASATGNVSITIDRVAYIAVTNADVVFNTPTNTDFNNGFIPANNSASIDYGSNAPHDLQIQLSGLGTKAVSDLEWSVDGGSSFTGMTTSAVNMVSQAGGGFNTQVVDFQMLLDWVNDVPGTYSGTITYTVVAN